MSRPRTDQALVERANALRQAGESYAPGARRSLGRLASFNKDLDQMRGSIGLDVAAMSRFNTQGGVNGNMDQALARAKTLSVAESQGDKQVKQTNLMQRAQMAGRARHSQFLADQSGMEGMLRADQFHGAKKQASRIRRGATMSALGTMAGGLMSGLTYGKAPVAGAPSGGVTWAPNIADSTVGRNFWNNLPKVGP